MPDNTILINIDLTSDQAAKKAEEVAEAVARVTAEQENMRKSGQKNTAAYVANQEQLKKLQRELRAYTTLTSAAEGSNDQLRAQLSLLNRQYDALSRTERENTAQGQLLQAQTRAISDELVRNEAATGRNYRTVGNYTNAIKDALGSQLPFNSSILSSLDTLGSFQGVLTSLSASIEANKIATELNTAAVQAQTVATEAETAATEAATVAANAAARASELAAEASAARTAADEALIRIETQLLAAEEREILVQEQLLLQQRALVAETVALTASNEALALAELEVAAAQTAQAETAAAATASTAALAATQQAASAKSALLSSSFKAAGVAIVAAMAVAALSVAAFAKQYDQVGDFFERQKDRISGSFTELGRQITLVYSNSTGVFDFIKRFVTGFGEITKATNQAGKEIEAFTGRFQDLEDLKDVVDVTNQSIQAQVSRLRTMAKNRSLDNDDRQAYLRRADQLERDALDNTKKYNQQYIDAAVDFANRTKGLTKEQVEALQARNGDYGKAIQVANDLLNQEVIRNGKLNKGVITQDAYKRLKEAYQNYIGEQEQSNQQLEKINNEQDKYAEQAAAKAEKRQEQLKKIAEDRVKSELATASTLLTVRQKEFQDINADIDKRVKLYQEYGQSTVQLEKERTARVGALAKKFSEEDLKTITQNTNEAERLRIATITDADEKRAAQLALDQNTQLQAVDQQIMSVAARMALGEQGLTDLLQSYVTKRNEVVANGNLQREQNQAESDARLLAAQETTDAGLKAIRDRQVQNEIDAQQQRFAIDQERISSAQSVLDTIVNAAGKESAVGKAAFVLQKAFAIAEIAINAQREISALNAAYANLKLQASIVPFAGPFLVGALTAAQAAETAQIVTRAIVSGAIVAASTIGAFATGGVYKSDGAGAILQGPGTGTSDSINARLSNGEAVISAKATKMFLPQLSAMNVAGGGKAFANGGVYGNVPIITGNVNSRMQFQRDLAAAISGITVVTDVKDVITQTGIRNRVVSAGNV